MLKHDSITGLIHDGVNMQYFKKNRHKMRGFTIVELLVSIFVFSLVVGSSINIFFFSIKAQRRVLSTQQLVNQTSFLQEYMGRAIRQAAKELGDPTTCLTTRGDNYEITRSGAGLKFINRDDECQEFFLTGGRIKEDLDSVEQFLTPDEFQVSALNFAITGESQTDNLQPRVTLFMDIGTIGIKPESRVSIQTQTTISQRRNDIVE